MIALPTYCVYNRAACICFIIASVLLSCSIFASSPHTARPLLIKASGKTGFQKLTSARTGITFSNSISKERAITNQILLNGSGVTAADINADGFCDIVFGNLSGGFRVYINNGGFRFTDATEKMGSTSSPWASTGVTLADLNGDRLPDLIVNTLGNGSHYYTNSLGQSWVEQPRIGELDSTSGSMSSAIADIDGDGDLDLYVTNYRKSTIRDNPKQINSKPIKTHPTENSKAQFLLETNGNFVELGEADQLFINNGNGVFSLGSDRFRGPEGRPLSALLDWGLSAIFRDLNGDRAPDLYVCNDFSSPDRLWINDGGGRFSHDGERLLPYSSYSSMGVDVADINRDGRMDFFVVDMLSFNRRDRLIRWEKHDPLGVAAGILGGIPQYDRNTMFIARGDGTFYETAAYSGLAASNWSWCPAFIDVDLDGYEDLLLSTGYERDVTNRDVVKAMDDILRRTQPSELSRVSRNESLKTPPLALSKMAFRNRKDLTFEECSKDWGFSELGFSKGMCFADLDNDGDLDVIVNPSNGPAEIYENQSIAPRIKVRLSGSSNNTDGIGALIEVTGGPNPQSQEVFAGGRYLSSDEPIRVFAAGSTTNILAIRVIWRNGKVSLVRQAFPNHEFIINEPENSSTMPTNLLNTQISRVVFEDKSAWIDYRHSQSIDDDFSRQPSLPFKNSAIGPGVSIVDYDHDGFSDIVIAGSRGSRPALFKNLGGNGFAPFLEKNKPPILLTSQTSITPYYSLDRGSHLNFLMLGLAHNETGGANLPKLGYFGTTRIPTLTNVVSRSGGIGVIASADIDHDGHLEVFFGGRPIPGRFPESSQSILARLRSGRWEVDLENSSTLGSVGAVQSASFFDANGDGWIDLVTAESWGGIRLFENHQGRLVEMTSDWGLGHLMGFWNSIAPGDFDGDGRMDLIVGNMGSNTDYNGALPLRIISFDSDHDQIFEVFETTWDSTSNDWVPVRTLDELKESMPDLVARIPSHRAFAEGAWKVAIDAVTGPKLIREINNLNSILLINRQNKFNSYDLPMQIQLSPSFGLVVADFDADGNEDIAITQNQRIFRPDRPPAINGEGFLLLGDGRGAFQTLMGRNAGFRVLGEGRGLAVGDLDNDGRVDILAGVLGDSPGIYLNRSDKRGISIRLRGRPENPTAIGAEIRVQDESGNWGPKRVVRLGGGYLSCDDSTQIMGFRGKPRLIKVNWPSGEQKEYPVKQINSIFEITE